jgi:hypothetical protein
MRLGLTFMTGTLAVFNVGINILTIIETTK